MRDLLAGAIFIAFSAAFLYFSGDIRDPGFDPLGPAFLPRFVLYPILFLSLILLISGYRQVRAEGNQAGDAQLNWQDIRNPLLLLIQLAVFIWFVVERIVPFEVSGTIFIITAGLTLAGLGNRRLIAWIIAVAVTVPFLVGFIFKTYLYVNLP